MFRRLALSLLGLFLTGIGLRAQDVPSGPEKGETVPALKVFDATGPHEGKEVDYAAERKDRPTFYLLIQSEKWDRPMARFVKGLDHAVGKEKDGLVVAVWLTDDVGKAKEYLPRARQSLQLEAAALTVYPGEKSGPKGWNANDEAHITVVAADKGKVLVTWGYRTINETELRAVLKAVQKARDGK